MRTKKEIAAYQKKYHEENKEKLKIKRRAYLLKNQDAILIYHRKYWQENKHELNQKRRVKRLKELRK